MIAKLWLCNKIHDLNVSTVIGKTNFLLIELIFLTETNEPNDYR